MPPRRRSLDVIYEPRELAVQLWLQLLRTVNQHSRHFEASLAQFDLTLPQFDMLATLAAGQGVTQQQLAERLLVTKGNICGLLDRLESAGLLERRPDDADRRANRIHLTTAGLALFRRAMPDQHKRLERAFSRLSASQQQSLLHLLEALEPIDS